MTEDNESIISMDGPKIGSYLTLQQAEQINDFIWVLGNQIFEILSDAEFTPEKH